MFGFTHNFIKLIIVVPNLHINTLVEKSFKMLVFIKRNTINLKILTRLKH